MNTIIFFILLSFVIISYIQARSIDTIESDVETDISNEQDKKQLFNDQYSRLLTYLKNQETKTYNDDSDSSPSNTKDDTKPMSKRGFFLFPTRRSSQRYRPTYSYGRKSHWDTFFGKK